MKILYSCFSKSWGGMEMYTLTAIEQLVSRNIETELLCHPGTKIQVEADRRGIKYYSLKASGYVNPIISYKIARLINRNKYDIVHTQASKDLFILVSALKLASSTIPLILTKQVGSFIEKKDKLHKWVYDRVTYVLAISKVIQKNLLETCPIELNKIKLLHNGVDMNKFNPDKYDGQKTRKEFNIKENEIVIGMLARFSWGKGHEEFLYAAKQLVKKYNNLKFMIVGEASRGEREYANKIMDMAERYSLKDSVIFTDFRNDTPNVLASMNIFAFPSHSEAFGIALVEAMAMGKPSVCSNSDGILDIAVNGTTSYLFQKQDGRDLKEKLEMLITSEEKRNSFGHAARKHAVEKFEIGILTDRVLSIYKESLDQLNQ